MRRLGEGDEAVARLEQEKAQVRHRVWMQIAAAVFANSSVARSSWFRGSALGGNWKFTGGKRPAPPPLLATTLGEKASRPSLPSSTISCSSIFSFIAYYN